MLCEASGNMFVGDQGGSLIEGDQVGGGGHLKRVIGGWGGGGEG